MTDRLGQWTPDSHPAPLRAVGDGASLAPTPKTHAATVVAVVGGEGGNRGMGGVGGERNGVLHEVRLLGQIVPLRAPAEIPVGTVLEVVAVRTGSTLVAALPTDLLAGGGGLAGPISSGGAASPALAPSTGSTDPSAGANPGFRAPADLPLEVAALLRSEGIESEPGIVAARRLLRSGVDPTGALLRGGAVVEAAPTEASPVTGTRAEGARLGGRSLAALSTALSTEVAEAIERAVDGAAEARFPRELTTSLAAFARLFRDRGVPPRELGTWIELLASTITRRVDAALARDPRLVAAREAMAELMRDPAHAPVPRTRPDQPVNAAEAALTRGLTAEAKLRGLRLLGNLEQKAIEEHPIHREWRPLLREIFERSNVLSYRLAVELAERDGGVRSDPQNTWFVETPLGRPVRVRRELREGNDGAGESSDAEQTFRIETHGGILGEIVIEGARRVHDGETLVGLELSAESERTHEALDRDLAELTGSFEGTGIRISTTVVPWRRAAPEAPVADAEPSRTTLDRRV